MYILVINIMRVSMYNGKCGSCKVAQTVLVAQ